MLALNLQLTGTGLEHLHERRPHRWISFSAFADKIFPVSFVCDQIGVQLTKLSSDDIQSNCALVVYSDCPSILQDYYDPKDAGWATLWKNGKVPLINHLVVSHQLFDWILQNAVRTPRNIRANLVLDVDQRPNYVDGETLSFDVEDARLHHFLKEPKAVSAAISGFDFSFPYSEVVL